MRVLNSFVIILFIGVCLHSTAQEKVFDDVERLVVTINGNFLEWGEKTGTFGAGIIFGYRNDDIYIVTCNHVVREKPSNKIATDILIKLKDYPGDSLEAIVTDHFDAELDIAVLKLEMNQISFDRGQ